MKLIECVVSREQESLSAAYIPFWMLTGCLIGIAKGRGGPELPFPLSPPLCVESFEPSPLLRLASGSPLSLTSLRDSAEILRLLSDDICIVSRVVRPFFAASLSDFLVGSAKQNQ